MKGRENATTVAILFLLCEKNARVVFSGAYSEKAGRESAVNQRSKPDKMDAFDMMWIFLGGGLGSLSRWGVGLVTKEKYKGDFPLGNFITNMSGAFLFCFLATLFDVDWHIRHGSPLSSFILTGILGGYTAFSYMQLDAVLLADSHKHMLSFFYLFSSLVGGLIAAGLGIFTANLF